MGGGGEGTSVEILFEISPECRNTFLPKSRIFRKFSRYFYTITPKITFYCIFINKFHKNFEKSAKKFSLRLRYRKPVEILFFQKRGFFEIFETYLHTTPPKSLFIAFLLINFPKISKKVLKNFWRRLRRQKRVFFVA